MRLQSKSLSAKNRHLSFHCQLHARDRAVSHETETRAEPQLSLAGAPRCPAYRGCCARPARKIRRRTHPSPLPPGGLPTSRRGAPRRTSRPPADRFTTLRRRFAWTYKRAKRLQGLRPRQLKARNDAARGCPIHVSPPTALAWHVWLVLRKDLESRPKTRISAEMKFEFRPPHPPRYAPHRGEVRGSPTAYLRRHTPKRGTLSARIFGLGQGAELLKHHNGLTAATLDDLSEANARRRGTIARRSSAARDPVTEGLSAICEKRVRAPHPRAPSPRVEYAAATTSTIMPPSFAAPSMGCPPCNVDPFQGRSRRTNTSKYSIRSASRPPPVRGFIDSR